MQSIYSPLDKFSHLTTDEVEKVGLFTKSAVMPWSECDSDKDDLKTWNNNVGEHEGLDEKQELGSSQSETSSSSLNLDPPISTYERKKESGYILSDQVREHEGLDEKQELGASQSETSSLSSLNLDPPISTYERKESGYILSDQVREHEGLDKKQELGASQSETSIFDPSSLNLDPPISTYECKESGYILSDQIRGMDEKQELGTSQSETSSLNLDPPISTYECKESGYILSDQVRGMDKKQELGTSQSETSLLNLDPPISTYKRKESGYILSDQVREHEGLDEKQELGASHSETSSIFDPSSLNLDSTYEHKESGYILSDQNRETVDRVSSSNPALNLSMEKSLESSMDFSEMYKDDMTNNESDVAQDYVPPLTNLDHPNPEGYVTNEEVIKSRELDRTSILRLEENSYQGSDIRYESEGFRSSLYDYDEDGGFDICDLNEEYYHNERQPHQHGAEQPSIKTLTESPSKEIHFMLPVLNSSERESTYFPAPYCDQSDTSSGYISELSTY